MKRILIFLTSVLFSSAMMSLVCSCNNDEEQGFVVTLPDPDDGDEESNGQGGANGNTFGVKLCGILGVIIQLYY